MKPLRRQTLATAIQLSLLISVPGLAAAQDTPPTDEATTLDQVTVTGSRIKKADLEAQVPVQTLSRADIERTGLTSIADVLQEITGAGSALNTKFNSSGNFGFPPDGSGVGAGSATVDLRHLGSKRVLVLVDGVRWVNEASASGVSSSTDLNTIPLAIVERIEVLEDGASSLYGSDAIAGVVNIITRRNFEGVQVTSNYGVYEKGDGETYGADVAWGGGTDRASWFLGASYVKQEPIFSRDREHAGVPVPGTGLTFGSSATPFGRFVFTDPNTGVTYNLTPNAGATDPTYDPTQTGCTRTDDFHCFTTADRFNFSQFNMLLTPSERTGVFGQFRFDFSDNVSMYAKALFNRRESVNQAAPEPIFLGPAGATGNPYADGVVISATNPYNPFGFDLDSASNLALVGRRPIEGGPRVFEQEVDTWYVGTGLEGRFGVGERTWFWDVNLAASENKADQTNFGSYNIRNINLALGDLATCQATAGCVPLNIFGGPGTITPEMLGWISPVVRDRSENRLQLFTANLSGDLFDMWAGPLAFATGFEYRKYEGEYTPDPINYVTMPDGTVENHYNGVPSLPTSGEYDVNEMYVELAVPLLRDSVFGKSLDLSLAGRYSDYSTFGGEFTPKYGLRWQPVDELLFRTTYAEGFRAPSIGELFGSASRFDATLDDPCQIGLDGSPPSGSAANCAALGVPAGSQQVNSQISVTTGGNPDLDPERSRSFSIGMVWTPSLLEDTAISRRVDIETTFYRHTITGAVQAIDAQTQLDLCVETLDPVYCDGITRAATGDINGFNNRLQNLGVIKTDGWDVDVFWTFPETSFGTFRLTWQNTFVGRYEAFGADGSLQPRRPGVEVNDSAIPEWTSTTTLDWKHGNWNASWTARHISELEEECGDAASFPVCSNPGEGTNTLDATTFHDVQVGYKFDWLKGLQVSAGVNNVFGEEPPICLSCSLNGYDASTYDVPGGGFYYLRADLRF
ncbi:MAG: TonB-dependent receptor [Arenimonas sp.]|nr:TonB-dependent receptor [Arenimonas sp.]